MIKTKEQRAAERAAAADAPTLTLEDFLESERHKLTGTLTPVTPETFAKWKKERMDKKAAEEAAIKAKDITGRALFEAGGIDDSEEESDSEDDEEQSNRNWNLERLRKETERLQMQREEERLKQGYSGTSAENGEPSAEASAAVSVNGDTNDEGAG